MAKILIVEHDEVQRFLYYEELVEEGYEMVLAKNGLEALKCLEKSPFDLMMLDIIAVSTFIGLFQVWVKPATIVKLLGKGSGLRDIDGVGWGKVALIEKGMKE